MPQENQETSQEPELPDISELESLEEAAAALRTAASNHKTTWASEKDAFINWLKVNVGQDINSSMNHLQDVIVNTTVDLWSTAKKYLKESKAFLNYTNDPRTSFQITDGPRAEDGATNLDGSEKQLPDLTNQNDQNGSNIPDVPDEQEPV